MLFVVHCNAPRDVCRAVLSFGMKRQSAGGTLNLAAGERQEVFYYPLSVADGGSMQEIRIKAAVLSLLVEETQL